MTEKTMFKERYEITCPDCGYSMLCAPSIFHRMGQHEMGGGSCSACHCPMQITYQPETDTMQANDYKVYNDERQTKH